MMKGIILDNFDEIAIEPQKLLLVDDTPTNLDLLLDILQNDYDIRVALNGFDALKQVEIDKPDLILLDVLLPDVSGYEVCRRLKNDPETRDISVIFISSRNSTDAQLEGFNVGGVDYILKSFKN
ncbi:Two-component response regulator [Borrelia duttonii CR2A]|uniref:Two-component response regulator n=1 Tax=Borrelia duttonii CR2A TaxID=1432657 RepID=W6TM91_9SPIR|nr:Two-component response regulator [Borrelia duttonii CR2A]